MTDEEIQKQLEATDYLTETLQTDMQAQKEIFAQMLYRLENSGECHYVYHRLARVLFNDPLGDSE